MKEDRVDWLIKLTEDKKLKWHKADSDVNEHCEEQRLKKAFWAAHSTPGVGGRFGGAYIGWRGQKKVLCVVIIDGTGNWIYIDAKKDVRMSAKRLLSAVRKTALKKEDCARCKELGW